MVTVSSPRKPSCAPRMKATATIQASVTGMRNFQPKRMNWSYRMRGSVPRSHTKNHMNIHILRVNHSRPHQPPANVPSPMAEMSGGAAGPPRNIVVASAETVNMLTYSPRKNIANVIAEYSVWKPPTSSPSPSARSKGRRLVSPTMVMT